MKNNWQTCSMISQSLIKTENKFTNVKNQFNKFISKNLKMKEKKESTNLNKIWTHWKEKSHSI